MDWKVFQLHMNWWFVCEHSVLW